MAAKKNVAVRLTPAKMANSGSGILDNMAHERLWEQVAKLNPEKIAKRARCRLLSDPDRCIVTMLNSQYEVNLGERSISVVRDDSASESAGYIEQLCILAYLLGAKDILLAGKLVKAESLPGGQFFFRGLHTLPTDRLARACGAYPFGGFSTPALTLGACGVCRFF